MGKQVETVYECDATNCGVTTSDPTEAFNVEIRIWSDGNPGVQKLQGVLDEAHATNLENSLRDNFGMRGSE